MPLASATSLDRLPTIEAAEYFRAITPGRTPGSESLFGFWMLPGIERFGCAGKGVVCVQRSYSDNRVVLARDDPRQRKCVEEVFTGARVLDHRHPWRRR